MSSLPSDCVWLEQLNEDSVDTEIVCSILHGSNADTITCAFYSTVRKMVIDLFPMS